MLNDLALDVSTNDLLIADNKLAFVAGIYYVRQKLKVRLQWFLGEWFLNTALGLPYFTDILTKNPNMTSVAAYFKRVILQTEGVDSLESFSFEFYDTTNRAIKIVFVAKTSYGRLSFNETLEVTA